ncbi:MAG: ATP-binding protein, partial [Chloroflexota bacterium]
NLQSLKLAQEIGDRGMEAHTYNNIAMNYARLENFAQVNDMLHRALQLFQTLNDTRGTTLAYNNLAMLHTTEEAYAEALEEALKGWDIAKSSSMTDLQTTLLDTLGQIYTKMEHYDQALKYLNTGRRIAETHDLKRDLVYADLNIARIYHQQQRYIEAIAQATRALTLAEWLDSQQTLFECHELLADAYQAVGNFECSLSHHKQFHGLHSTVFAEDRDRNFARLEVRYRTEAAKKEMEIYRQKNAELEYEITERKKVEEALVKAKESAEIANHAKSRCIATMSHELRTPLNGILGYTQLLMHDPHLNTDQQEGVDIIHRSGTHLLTLINDILDISKIEAKQVTLETSEIYLSSFLDGIIAMMRMNAENNGLVLQAFIEPNLPRRVIADEKRLRQVLINLLGNAIKFTQRGRVAFKVLHIEQARQQITGNISSDINKDINKDISSDIKNKQSKKYSQSKADRDTDLINYLGDIKTNEEQVESGLYNNNQHIEQKRVRLHFEIRDTGVGIAPENLGQIFQPFEQVGDRQKQRAGTGLGLAISQEFIQAMGSQICVESKIGKGSRFWFDLDLAAIDFPMPTYTTLSLQKTQSTIQTNAPLLNLSASHMATIVRSQQKKHDSEVAEVDSLDGTVVDGTVVDGTVVDISVAGGATTVHAAQSGDYRINTFQQNTMNRQPAKIRYEGAPLRLMVVVDDMTNRRVLEHTLNLLGFETILATTGAEAIRLAERWQPHGILMDLYMPHMHGDVAAQKIRTQHPDTQLIAVSASVYEVQQEEHILSAFDAFLPKPLSIEQLMETLQRVLSIKWEIEYSQTNTTNSLWGASAGIHQRGETHKHQTNQSFSLPSSETIQYLHQLARRGDMLTLQTELKDLQTMDSALYSFTDQFLELAKTFDDEEIIARLENYLKNEYIES